MKKLSHFSKKKIQIFANENRLFSQGNMENFLLQKFFQPIKNQSQNFPYEKNSSYKNFLNYAQRGSRGRSPRRGAGAEPLTKQYFIQKGKKFQKKKSRFFPMKIAFFLGKNSLFLYFLLMTKSTILPQNFEIFQPKIWV